MSNALKFSLNKPIIKITCKTIAADEIPVQGIKTKPKYVELNFKDNGIGFDVKNADRIFSIFERLHTKEEFSGTGWHCAKKFLRTMTVLLLHTVSRVEERVLLFIYLRKICNNFML